MKKFGKFLLQNLIALFYYAGFAAVLFTLLCIVITPFVQIFSKFEIDWFLFVLCAILSIGSLFAYIMSIIKFTNCILDVWHRFKITVNFDYHAPEE